MQENCCSVHKSTIQKAISSQYSRCLVLKQPCWPIIAVEMKWWKVEGLVFDLVVWTGPLWSELLPAGLSDGSFGYDQCFPNTDQTGFVSTSLASIWSHPEMLLLLYLTHTYDLQQSFSMDFFRKHILYRTSSGNLTQSQNVLCEILYIYIYMRIRRECNGLQFSSNLPSSV